MGVTEKPKDNGFWAASRKWIAAHKIPLAIIFWLLALGIPMTPIGGTSLGYVFISVALIFAIPLFTAAIWNFSAGIRYDLATGAHVYGKYEKCVRGVLIGGFNLIIVLIIVIAFLISRSPTDFQKATLEDQVVNWVYNLRKPLLNKEPPASDEIFGIRVLINQRPILITQKSYDP